MRFVAAFAFFIVSGAAAFGQEQEQKLMDRVMKPNMSLQNDAQNKQFALSGTTTMKTAPTKSFYIADRPAQKQFAGTRAFAGLKSFFTKTTRDTQHTADLATRGGAGNLHTAYAAGNYRGVRTASDAAKMVDVPEFTGSRPFLAEGKNQKNLDTKNPPMTLDEVRDLLNKNK